MVLNILVGIKLLLTHPLVSILGVRNIEMFPLENKLMSEFESKLKPEELAILKLQLDEVNLIERLHKPKTLITFNLIAGLTCSLKRKRKLFENKDEYAIKKIDFNLHGHQYSVTFYVVYGNLFSMEFSDNMSNWLDSDDIEIVEK